MVKYCLFTEIVVYQTFYVVPFTRVTFLLTKVLFFVTCSAESACIVVCKKASGSHACYLLKHRNNCPAKKILHLQKNILSKFE